MHQANTAPPTNVVINPERESDYLKSSTMERNPEAICTDPQRDVASPTFVWRSVRRSEEVQGVSTVAITSHRREGDEVNAVT